MTHSYYLEYGKDWLERISNADQRAAWGDRRDAEMVSAGRRGVAPAAVSTALLDYSNFYELRNIAKEHWAPLAAALGKARETMPLLNRFDQVRNTVAHSRDLLPHEIDLLSGIAGELRNKVTIYMSSQDAGGNYFPRVERVSDQFGHTIDNTQTENFMAACTTGEVLRVGQRVQYTCVGIDPQGRELEWELMHSDVSPTSGDVELAHGTNVTLTWDIRPEHVRHHAATVIQMKALGTPYHRHSRFVEQVEFHYRVLPPLQQ